MSKLDGGTERDRQAVPPVTKLALVRCYLAAGTEQDEKEDVELIQRAKTSGLWIACDCLGAGAAPPLLSPAYLLKAETYYLRRLTGADHPEHDFGCPFFRD